VLPHEHLNADWLPPVPSCFTSSAADFVPSVGMEVSVAPSHVGDLDSSGSPDSSGDFLHSLLFD